MSSKHTKVSSITYQNYILIPDFPQAKTGGMCGHPDVHIDATNMPLSASISVSTVQFAEEPFRAKPAWDANADFYPPWISQQAVAAAKVWL
jgi:hypothetical protein